jgi:hypothetical protein
LPGGFSTLGLEKPSGNFFQRDRFSTAATLAGQVSLGLGLLLQTVGKQRTGNRITDFAGPLFDLDELHAPGRIALRTPQILSHIRYHCRNSVT